MKYTKYILLSTLCLGFFISCGKEEPEIIPVQTDSNVDFQENVEDSESTEVNQAGVTNVDSIPEISYYIYEGDFSYGTDEKILFFYSDDNEDSIKIDENLSSETELKTFSDIFRIDMQSDNNLVIQYDVTEANTFILVDENGNFITKTIGASSSSDLIKLYD